ncbi:hypothetical protein ACLH4C_004871, partial [Aeromonas salmonicida]
HTPQYDGPTYLGSGASTSIQNRLLRFTVRLKKALCHLWVFQQNRAMTMNFLSVIHIIHFQGQ